MPQVQQVIRYSHEDIKRLLTEKAKADFTEEGGKLVQGKSSVEFGKAANDELVATVTFERAGK